MRILNRPMFKYGGPIKEGVMHGMKNGGRAALVGHPIFPKTDGREHHLVQFALPALYAAGRFAARPFGQFLMRQSKGGKLLGLSPVKQFVPSWLGKQFIKDPLYKTVAGGTTAFGRGLKWTGQKAAGAGKYAFGTPSGLLFMGAPVTIAGGKWLLSDGTELNDNQKKQVKQVKQEGVPGGGSGMHGTGEWFEAEAQKKLAADAKKARTKKLSRYLELMGYDRSKKTALSDALIDASAIVQAGTEEGGSLKHSDWSKMINQAIQTTSKRYDKPEAIREAVGLMMTKGEIEKDIAAEKGTPLDIQEKYYQGKLGEAGAERKMLNKPTSLAEAVNLTKATDTTGNRTSQALRHYFDGHLVPEFKGKISKKKLDALGGMEDLTTGVEIGLGDGVYQVSNSYIIVQGNKIIGGDDVFASEK